MLFLILFPNKKKSQVVVFLNLTKRQDEKKFLDYIFMQSDADGL